MDGTLLMYPSYECHVTNEAAPVSEAAPQIDPVSRSAIRHTAPPGVRFVCASTVYDEALVDGHWLGRTWTASAAIPPEQVVSAAVGRLRPYLSDAFVLEIGGLGDRMERMLSAGGDLL